MLTLEEKGIPYNKLLLDESSIPEWCAVFLTKSVCCARCLVRLQVKRRLWCCERTVVFLSRLLIKLTVLDSLQKECVERSLQTQCILNCNPAYSAGRPFCQTGGNFWLCSRVKEVCEGQKQIPFALELETGKWCVYPRDQCHEVELLSQPFA